MKGHVTQRSPGSWSVVIYRGKGPDGKKKYDWHSVKGTRKDAEAELHRKLHELNTGSYVDRNRDTLGHATIAITLDLYRHVLPDMQEEAARKVALVMAAASKRRGVDGNAPAGYPANTGSQVADLQRISKRPIRAHGTRARKPSS